MVFEAISKSISTITDKVTDSVGSPLEQVKETVKKGVQFSPKADLIEQLSAFTQHQLILEHMHDLLYNLFGSVEGLTSKQRRELLAPLRELYAAAQATWSVDQLVELVTTQLTSYTKQSSATEPVSAYHDQSWTTDTQLSISKTQHQQIIVTVQELAVKFDQFVAQLSEHPAMIYLEGSRPSYDHKGRITTYREQTKQATDQLLDHEYAITKLQRKLIYQVLELKRAHQHYLDLADQNDLSNAKKKKRKTYQHTIAQLRDHDIPAQLQEIEQQQQLVQDDEDLIQQAREDYTSSYISRQTDRQDRLTSNIAATYDLIDELRQEEKKHAIQVDKQLNKLEQSTTTLQKLSSKIWNLPPEQLQETLHHREQLYQQLSTHHYDQLRTLWQWAGSYTKDVALAMTLTEHYQTHLEQEVLLLKEQRLTTKLLNRFKRKHSDLAKSSRDDLVEIKAHGLTKLTLLMKKIESHHHAYQTTYQHNQAGNRDVSKHITQQRKWLKETSNTIQALNHTTQRIHQQRDIDLITTHLTHLNRRSEIDTSYKKALHQLIDNATGSLKQSSFALEDAKKRVELKDDTKSKKHLHDTEASHHQHELCLEIVQHYFDQIDEQLEELSALISAYQKKLTELQKDHKHTQVSLNKYYLLHQKHSFTPKLPRSNPSQRKRIDLTWS